MAYTLPETNCLPLKMVVSNRYEPKLPGFVFRGNCRLFQGGYSFALAEFGKVYLSLSLSLFPPVFAADFGWGLFFLNIFGQPNIKLWKLDATRCSFATRVT